MFIILKLLLRNILHYKLQNILPNNMNTVVHYNNIICYCINNIKFAWNNSMPYILL